MKGKYLLFILLLSQTISAQLSITPGSQFSMVGNIQLTLQNMDLINNGNFATANNRVSFSGNNSTAISGSQLTQFFEIEINKTNGSLLRLQRSIRVTNRVLFTSGFLNLNGFDTDLGNSGHLDGEQENTRVIGPNGGQVLFNVNLNAPASSNPANLGVFITSNQNLGNVTLKRGHQTQVIPGVGNSTLRYYDILPANNTNLNATLRFSYFDGELNGLTENQLTYYRTTDLLTWSALGFTSRDTVNSFVDDAGIFSFSRFTLSSGINSPLAVRFTLFNIKCEGGSVLVAWKTGQELGSHHFDIERSADGIRWTVIGSRAATVNSNTEKTYSYNDNNPLQNAYYRIAEYGLDGRVQYTGIIRSTCSMPETFSIWPNPSHDHVFINIVSSNESTAMIKLFDSKGALVKMQRAILLEGSNQLTMELKFLPQDAYTLYAEWNNGQMKKTVKLLKQ